MIFFGVARQLRDLIFRVVLRRLFGVGAGWSQLELNLFERSIELRDLQYESKCSIKALKYDGTTLTLSGVVLELKPTTETTASEPAPPAWLTSKLRSTELVVTDLTIFLDRGLVVRCERASVADGGDPSSSSMMELSVSWCGVALVLDATDVLIDAPSEGYATLSEAEVQVHLKSAAVALQAERLGDLAEIFASYAAASEKELDEDGDYFFDCNLPEQQQPLKKVLRVHVLGAFEATLSDGDNIAALRCEALSVGPDHLSVALAELTDGENRLKLSSKQLRQQGLLWDNGKLASDSLDCSLNSPESLLEWAALAARLAPPKEQKESAFLKQLDLTSFRIIALKNLVELRSGPITMLLEEQSGSVTGVELLLCGTSQLVGPSSFKINKERLTTKSKDSGFTVYEGDDAMLLGEVEEELMMIRCVSGSVKVSVGKAEIAALKEAVEDLAVLSGPPAEPTALRVVLDGLELQLDGRCAFKTQQLQVTRRKDLSLRCQLDNAKLFVATATAPLISVARSVFEVTSGSLRCTVDGAHLRLGATSGSRVELETTLAGALEDLGGLPERSGPSSLKLYVFCKDTTVQYEEAECGLKLNLGLFRLAVLGGECYSVLGRDAELALRWRQQEILVAGLDVVDATRDADASSEVTCGTLRLYTCSDSLAASVEVLKGAVQNYGAPKEEVEEEEEEEEEVVSLTAHAIADYMPGEREHEEEPIEMLLRRDDEFHYDDDEEEEEEAPSDEEAETSGGWFAGAPEVHAEHMKPRPEEAFRGLRLKCSAIWRLFGGSDLAQPTSSKKSALLRSLIGEEEEQEEEEEEDNLWTATKKEKKKKKLSASSSRGLMLVEVNAEVEALILDLQFELNCNFSASESASGPKRTALERWATKHDMPMMLRFQAYDWRVLKLRLCPLRCRLDAEFLRFLDAFFSSSSSTTDEDEMCVISSRQQEEVVIHKRSRKERLITLSVASLQLKLDYSPRGADLDQLRRGSVGEMMQIFALHHVRLVLKRRDVESSSIEGCFDLLRLEWVREMQEQSLKFVAGATPLRPIANLGRGLMTGNLGKASRAAALETARGARQLASGLAMALDSTADRCGGPPNRHRYDETTVTTTSRDGAEKAMRALTRGVEGLNDAARSVAVRRDARTLAKALPAGLLRPMAGLAESLACGAHIIQQAMEDDDDL